MSRVSEQVLRIASRGLRLFPVKSREKLPLVTDWPHQATNDKARLRLWLKQFPNCNWGVVTGPGSGVFVLDVDGDSGLNSLHILELQGCEMPQTLITQTARGSHIWLKWPDNGKIIRNSAGKLGVGLDVRGAGGYVVVPPSVHPSGVAYEFTDEDVPVAPAPDCLVEMLVEVSTAPEPSISTAKPQSDMVPIFEGQRNQTLMSLAGTMRRREMTLGAIETALVAENAARCAPPLPEPEVKAIARSVGRYTPAAKGNGKLQTAAQEWPAPLGSQAFYGLAGEFVRLVGPETEADASALLFSFLVAMGSIIGRGPYYQVEGDRHYTNLFAVLVGQSAKARKGTSWSQVHRFASMVDDVWCKQRVASGLSSGEGLIHAVRDAITDTVPRREGQRLVDHESQIRDIGVNDKRLMVVESELSQALQSARREGNTLSAIIREAWDGGPLRVLAKSAKATCLEPHISILAHITIAELKRQLTTNDMGNGFANRFLWLCVTRSKVLPFGGAVDCGALEELAGRTRQAIEFARCIERVEFVADARADWVQVYSALSEGRPGLLGAITARAEAQVVRLATLYALLDQSAAIRQEHLRAALEAWRYCEDSARFIFGDTLGDPTADEILGLLRRSEVGMTRNEITDHFKRNKSSAELGRALAILQSHGLAHPEGRETGGRTAEVWKAI